MVSEKTKCDGRVKALALATSKLFGNVDHFIAMQQTRLFGTLALLVSLFCAARASTVHWKQIPTPRAWMSAGVVYLADGTLMASTPRGLYQSSVGEGSWTKIDKIFRQLVNFWFEGDTVFCGTNDGYLLKFGAPGESPSFTSFSPYIYGAINARVRMTNSIVIASYLSPSQGILFESTDNGSTWETVYPNTSRYVERFFHGIARINDTTLLAAEADTLTVSTDLGKTWQNRIDSAFTSLLNFGDGLIAGNKNGLFRSTDEGRTWTSVLNQNISKIFPTREGGIVIITGDNRIFASDTSLHDWRNLAPPIPNATAVAVQGSTIVVSGDSTGVWKTTNDGSTWLEITQQDTVSSVALDTGTGIFASTGNGLFLSNDKGQFWTRISDRPSIFEIGADGARYKTHEYYRNLGSTPHGNPLGYAEGTCIEASVDAGLSWTDSCLETSDINSLTDPTAPVAIEGVNALGNGFALARGYVSSWSGDKWGGGGSHLDSYAAIVNTSDFGAHWSMVYRGQYLYEGTVQGLWAFSPEYWAFYVPKYTPSFSYFPRIVTQSGMKVVNDSLVSRPLSACMDSSGVCYIINGKGELYSTPDTFSTFVKISPPGFENQPMIEIASPSRGTLLALLKEGGFLFRDTIIGDWQLANDGLHGSVLEVDTRPNRFVARTDSGLFIAEFEISNPVHEHGEHIPIAISCDAYPNPSGQLVSVRLVAQEPYRAQLRISSLVGENLAERIVMLDAGSTKLVQFPVDEFPAGMYQLTVQGGGYLTRRSITIVR